MSNAADLTCKEAGGGAKARFAGALRAVSGLLRDTSERATDRRNALVAFGVRVTSAAILFASQIVLARWMGVAEYGLYVYAWTIVLVLGAIATVGLNLGAIRIVSELRETADADGLRGFMRISRLLVLTTGIAMTLAAILAARLFAGAHPTGPWAILPIILLAVPAYALTDLQDGISRGWARIASALIAPYILRPLFILAGIGLLVLSGVEMTAAKAATAAVAATWAAWAFQTIILARDNHQVLPNGARTYHSGKWIATSSPLLVMGIFDLAMQNIDVIAISNLLSPSDAGIYFAAAKTMALILFVQYAVGSSLANRFAAISTRGDTAALREAAGFAVRWTFWPSLTIAAVMLLTGPWLLSLFGPRFADGFPVMCILAFAIVVRAAIGPAEALLNMTGGQRDCARALMTAALANLVLSFALTPRFGIVGAACAVSIAMILGALLNWRAARRNLGIDIGIWAARPLPA
jgi:O-antigen/teichoic acid export membrane protein